MTETLKSDKFSFGCQKGTPKQNLLTNKISNVQELSSSPETLQKTKRSPKTPEKENTLEKSRTPERPKIIENKAAQKETNRGYTSEIDLILPGDDYESSRAETVTNEVIMEVSPTREKETPPSKNTPPSRLFGSSTTFQNSGVFNPKSPKITFNETPPPKSFAKPFASANTFSMKANPINSAFLIKSSVTPKNYFS